MAHVSRLTSCLFAGSLLVIFVGCASMDRLGTKMSVATRNIDDAPGKLVYEGVLTSAKKVGDLLALQFKGGSYYDVSNAGAFEPGDVVRIYQVKDGYEARLWRSAESAQEHHASPTGG